ncbi:hypothetical protein [Acinetobacter baumannii]|uniref:hypothetical protein n=1 Tax=Acinetobacter baumannii TaxID=470 RepID=UPI000BBB6E97|nr:hypothetical protein [Acinetobacter baumannii]MDC4317714.1 hypothetical protein [Acinetobacter baumannii]MDC5495568.1 hypothetical protein [Acinetobacter baumannii]MDC5509757.1 hypothetical protein [Acinetobacter baumannii]MDH2526740.1 hypothetical protein [Acinetobacter baumannii]PCE47856.1 hypothetical protein CO267_02815 [Acinetobacter baumannii]
MHQPPPNQSQQPTSDVESILGTLRDYGNVPENGRTQQTFNSNTTPSVEEEIASFSDKTLKEDAAKQDHDRNQKWKNHFNKAFIVAFWILWGCFIFMVLALILHWILPEKCHWLTPDQLDKIKTVIMAALVSKAVTTQQEKLSQSQ